jgi:hypothetical protein
VGVLTSPIIPGLNDVEIPKLSKLRPGRGAQFAGYGLVQSPLRPQGAVCRVVEATFPDRAGKILNRIREMRGGKLTTRASATDAW